MKISIDTNILARLVLQDEPKQAKIASELLRTANFVAIPLPCLCELVWILKSKTKLSNEEIISILENILEVQKFALNRPAVEAGLKLLKIGGDFADGVMEYEGSSLGGETFYSFDKKAIRLLKEQGKNVQLLD